MQTTDTGTGAGARGERATGVSEAIAGTFEAGKAGLSRVADSATEAGKQRLDTGIGRAADQVEQVGEALGEAAGRLRSSDQLGGLAAYTGRLADALGQLAERIRTRSVDDLTAEARQAARNNPVLFLAGSVAVGFALTRILKAGRTAGEGSGDAEYEAAESGYSGDDTAYAGGDSNYSTETRSPGYYADTGRTAASSGNADTPPSQASVPEASRGGLFSTPGSDSSTAGGGVDVPPSQASVPESTHGAGSSSAAGDYAELPVDQRPPSAGSPFGDSRPSPGGQHG